MTDRNRDLSSGARLDALLAQAASLWREYRCEHPAPRPGLDPTEDVVAADQRDAATYLAISATLIPLDARVLAEFAADPRVARGRSPFEGDTPAEMIDGVLRALIGAVTLDAPEQTVSNDDTAPALAEAERITRRGRAAA